MTNMILSDGDYDYVSLSLPCRQKNDKMKRNESTDKTYNIQTQMQ